MSKISYVSFLNPPGFPSSLDSSQIYVKGLLVNHNSVKNNPDFQIFSRFSIFSHYNWCSEIPLLDFPGKYIPINI